MATPLTEPIIGQNFSDIAQQRFNWANYSRQVEEENFRRAAVAQQTQNRYLYDLANMQQQAQQTDLQRQLEADATARSLALRRETGQEEAKRWAEEMAMKKSGAEADRAFAEKQLEASKTAQEEALKFQQDKYKQDTEYRGQAAAGQLAQASTAVNSLESQIDESHKRLDEIPKLLSNKKLDPMAALALRAEQTQKMANLPKLQAALTQAQGHYNAQLARVPQDFEVDPEAQTIYHRGLQKTWSFKSAVAKAAAAAEPTPEPAAPPESSWFMDTLRGLNAGANKVWPVVRRVLPIPGLGQDQTAAAPPSPDATQAVPPLPFGLRAPNQPVQVGRFLVSPATP